MMPLLLLLTEGHEVAATGGGGITYEHGLTIALTLIGALGGFFVRSIFGKINDNEKHSLARDEGLKQDIAALAAHTAEQDKAHWGEIDRLKAEDSKNRETLSAIKADVENIKLTMPTHATLNNMFNRFDDKMEKSLNRHFDLMGKLLEAFGRDTPKNK